MKRTPPAFSRPTVTATVGLLAVLAACGGGGGGSTPPVTPSSNALIWGSGTWGSKQWSATANAQIESTVPASSVAATTNQPSMETVR